MLSKYADEKDHPKTPTCSHQSEATEIVRQKDHSKSVAHHSAVHSTLVGLCRYVCHFIGTNTDRKGNERKVSAASMDLSPFLALLPIALLSLVFFFSTGRKSTLSHGGGRRSLPPSPLGFPLVGHLPLLVGSLPHRTLRAMAGTHGPVTLLRLGRVPIVVASSAAAAQEAMKTRDVAFAGRYRGPMVERLFCGRDMAFAPYGEHWRQARRVCVLHLLSQRCVLSFRRVRQQETAALLDRVRAAGVDDAAVNLSHLLVVYSSVVLLRAAFGNDDSSHGLDGEGKVLRKLLVDVEELLGLGTLGEVVPWLAWVDSMMGVHAKATRTFDALDGFLERGIADHHARRRGGRREGEGGDGNDDNRRSFVSVLLDAKEEEEAGGILFDTVAVKAIILVRVYSLSRKRKQF